MHALMPPRSRRDLPARIPHRYIHNISIARGVWLLVQPNLSIMAYTPTMSHSTERLEANDPRHVAIIMDGNGRWARARGLPRIEGHRRGVENVRAVVRAARDHGIQYLTLYAFSVENWQRPEEEVGALMDLLVRYLKQELKEMQKEGVRLQTIGQTEGLPPKVQAVLHETMKATEHFKKQTLILALNYGARSEVALAAQKLARDAAAGKLDPAKLGYSDFASYLDTAGTPDPDLIIRTSGEQRLSNFLLLQSAYSEFYFTDTPWPEFEESCFASAIEAYLSRERRFGKTGDQLSVAP